MQSETNTNVKNDEIEIDLLELFNVLLHRLWIIILVGAVTGAVGFAVATFVVTPMYESTTGIYILNKSSDNNISYSDTQLASQLTQDYAELIGCRYVIETVLYDCGLDKTYEELKSMISVKNVTSTRIIYITVKDSSPTRAQMIANSVREVASAHIKEVTEVEAVNVVDTANLPTEKCEPSRAKYTVVGAFLGMFMVAGFVVLKSILDDTIKTEDDIEKYLGLSTLAAIPIMDTYDDAYKKSEPSKKSEPKKVKKIDTDKTTGNEEDSSIPAIDNAEEE